MAQAVQGRRLVVEWPRGTAGGARPRRAVAGGFRTTTERALALPRWGLRAHEGEGGREGRAGEVGPAPQRSDEGSLTRREAAVGAGALWAAARAAEPGPARAEASAPSAGLAEDDLTITHRVFLDVGVCASATNMNRTLGAANIFCTDPRPIGRIEIGLYGKLVPNTVERFVQAVELGAFQSTVVSKIFKGQYLLAGKPGSRKYGEVEMPEQVSRSNQDLVSSKAFKVK